MATELTDPRRVPALSEDAWVTDAKQKADYLMAHFFLSDYSQTQLYVGNVSSMAWIIQATQGDMMQTVLQLRQALQLYFGRYFEDVVADVADNTPADSSAAEIVIYIAFKDPETGIVHTLNELLRERNGVFSRVASINNTGT
jgi:hypothetical protein